MIATMPSGIKHITVHIIDHTNWLFGGCPGWPAYAGWPGYAGGGGGGGGGGGWYVISTTIRTRSKGRIGIAVHQQLRGAP